MSDCGQASTFRAAWAGHQACTCVVVVIVLIGMRLWAAGGPPANGVEKVFVAAAAGQGSAEVERRLVRDLRKSPLVDVVHDRSRASAMVTVNAVIWPTGTESLNPRSGNTFVTEFQGWASVNVTDTSSQPLWSYLVTPRRFHVASISDDLADQLSSNLLTAVRRGDLRPALETGTVTKAGMFLRAAGATLPEPLYRSWFEAFRQRPGGFPITYDAVGSAAGLEQLAAQKVDFAASDIAEPTSAEVVRIPTVVGGVVPILHVQGLDQVILNLTPEVLADIFSGKITRWNDPRIGEWNRRVPLPDAGIRVVHRSDGSGTTYVWTHFLATASADWKGREGAEIDWPVGVGASGNLGVVEKVQSEPNAIGYVELTYAIQHRASYAAVRNPAGRFVLASLDSLGAAASRGAASGKDRDVSLLNMPGVDAYPVTTFTWFLVRRDLDAQKRRALADFLRWMLTSGQKQCESLGYAALPRAVAADELKTVDGLR